MKVKKLFGDIETNYLDGFQYKASKPSEEVIGIGGGIVDPNEVAVMKLRFIPTAEGYYDAISNKYIYNFTDHLGNVRLSYTDTNMDGSIQPRKYFWEQCDGPFNPPFQIPNCIDGWNPGEIVEVNNYYPFGLLHNYTVTTQNAYQYKYNGKELQETGMYDYGARMYMADLGRWGVVDPLAEQYRRWSPYNYAVNNPIRFIDPDGKGIEETTSGTTYTGADAQSAFRSLQNFRNNQTKNSNDDGDQGFWAGIKNFFGDIFGKGEKGAGIKTIVPGATISRSGLVVGEVLLEGVGSTMSFDAVLATLSRASIWSLPLMLEGDISKKEQTITLYRGVSSTAKGSMYFEAIQGIAIPNGFRQVATTWGPHRDMESHAGGDNLSIWTSWSTDKEIARDFATGVAFYEKGVSGVIMSRTFKLGEAVPNPFTLGEAEWLIPGVVYGAKVEYVLPRSK